MKSFVQFIKESDNEPADLSKFIAKKHNPSTGQDEWAFIDIHEPSKVFKYFGAEKPSDDEIRKELRAVEYYKHSAESVQRTGKTVAENADAPGERELSDEAVRALISKYLRGAREAENAGQVEEARRLRKRVKRLEERLALQEEEDKDGPADLSKFIDQKVNPETGKKQWAFISIHTGRAFKYYDHKPSDDEIRKELRNIEYRKHG